MRQLKEFAKRVNQFFNANLTRIHGTARLHNRKYIELAKGVQIGEYVIIRGTKRKVIIGSGCQINPFTVIYGGAGVVIGCDVMIGPHCMLAAGAHDYRQLEVPMRWAKHLEKGPIIIEDDVWLGAHVTVTDGVTIGRGSVIGANSVVSRSIPPYAIAAGVPAKVIRYRDGREFNVWPRE